MAMQDMARLDELCDADTPALAVAFGDDAEVLVTVMRDETTLRRHLHRALHAWERRPAARAGVPVAPAAAGDIDVSAGIPGFSPTNPHARLSRPGPQSLARASRHRHDGRKTGPGRVAIRRC